VKVEKKKLIAMIKKSMAQFAKEQNFIFYKPTLLVRLVEDTLHIINFDVYAKGFDCCVAIQPLFIPSDSIGLSFGNRLSHLGVHIPGVWGHGNEKEVISDLEEVQGLLLNNVLPWFDEVGYPKGMVEFLSDGNYEKNQEIIVGFPPFLRRLYLAMGYLYEADYLKAESELDKFYQLTQNDTRSWMLERKKFANQIAALIKTEDNNKITQHIEYIIKETKSNLKLKIN
jgi:hypothetical protein